MEHQKLSVEAIENGTVIDHIPAGLGLTILVGVLAIAFNAILDILYALIDPKIRY